MTRDSSHRPRDVPPRLRARSRPARLYRNPRTETRGSPGRQLPRFGPSGVFTWRPDPLVFATYAGVATLIPQRPPAGPGGDRPPTESQGQLQEAAERGDRRRHPRPRAGPPAHRQPERRHPRLGHPGYDASADYVADRLRAAGYTVTEQEFVFPFFRELTPAELGADRAHAHRPRDRHLRLLRQRRPHRAGVRHQPAPAVTAVALVQRGTCTFEQKAANAEAAGYDAVISFNEGNPGREELFIGTLGRPFDIPVVGLSFADAAALYSQLQTGPVTVHVSTETETEIDPTRTSRNIIADSPTGSADQVVVVGAAGRLGHRRAGHQRQRQRHLDHPRDRRGDGRARHQEPPEGPLCLLGRRGAEPARLPALRRHPQQQRPREDRRQPELRHARLPQLRPLPLRRRPLGQPPAGPPGSAQIEALFNDYFASQGLATDPTAFDGRSDYGPFISVGVPAGGLFSGAEGEKTAAKAAAAAKHVPLTSQAAA
jgi:PA domain